MPILIVGDFNLVVDGHDGGYDWEKAVCQTPGNPEGFVVTSDEHREAYAALEALIAENAGAFAHMVDPHLPTFKAWRPSARPDYALLRNAPAGGWSCGYRSHPVQEMTGNLQYWTDHIGLTVVVRRPAPDQIWLVTQ